MSEPRVVRKDVLRNRELLLASADAVIRERGMDLSLNAVAHHAGVGVGTVYRHFADRAALLQAMLEQRVDQIEQIMREHLADDDPVAGLRATIFAIGELQSSDRGMWEVLSASDGNEERAIVRARLIPLAEQLVARANATGRLRDGFTTNDLPVLLWTCGALNVYLGAVSPTAWRRYMEIMFDGLLVDRNTDSKPLTERPLSTDEVEAAMKGWQPPGGRRN